MANATAAKASSIQPRFSRFGDAPGYLDMCRDEFNKTVRSHVREFPIGKQGVAFDRHELDEWADSYITAKVVVKAANQDNNRPRSERQGATQWREKRSPVSMKKGGIWQIDKVFRGERIRESTGTGDRQEAEQYLIHKLENLRQQRVYGIRGTRTWEETATRFLIEYKDQPSIKLSAHHLAQLNPYLKDLPLTHIDDQALEEFVADRLSG